MAVNQNIPVWVLNLKKDEEKRLFMSKQLNSLGVKFDIIEAIDGMLLNNEQLRLYSKELALLNYKRELALGEIGCSLSHIRMWRRIVENDYKEVLILEDDIHVGFGLFEVVNNLDKIPKGYEYINFSKDAATGPYGDFITDIYRVSYFHERGYGTYAYLITKTGAEKLLNLAYPIFLPVDVFIFNANLQTYGVYPRVVVLAELDSSIGERKPFNESKFKDRKWSEFINIMKSSAIFLGISPTKMTNFIFRMFHVFNKRS